MDEHPGTASAPEPASRGAHDSAELLARLSGVGVRDAARLRSRVQRAARAPGPQRRAEMAAAAEAVAAAELALVERAASVPLVAYPPDLPVSARRAEIAAAIAQHQVVVLAGETGSGKTTQLPKILLEAGRGVRGMIGHTQPRRIAARAVAERVAHELGGGVGGPGDVVGYAVRFTDQVSPSTLVKLMTDGILLAEIGRDRDLLAYDTIVIDEAHERSLTIDFLLGYLTSLLRRRSDLKVVITSATIDPGRFAEHFGGAPVVEVSGRTYPVQVRYRPLVEELPPEAFDEQGEPVDDAAPAVVRDQVEAIVDAVAELEAEPDGDVLVFLAGEREIRDTADALGSLGLARTEVVPLYARLSAAEQHRVFESRPPGIARRIVLATNVAETSLTVPGIRYVVDPGTARISRYSLRSKVQRLPVEAISQASAAQRAGRCGRVADGVCIRLYGQADFEARPRFTDPEVQRTNLAAVLLRMAALDLGAVEDFPFVDPPDARAVRDGVALLDELGALEPADARQEGSGGSGVGPGSSARRLTAVGRRLADLPIDPRLARMVVEAERAGVLPEVLVVVAALSVQDPRERPSAEAGPGAQQAAAQHHARFADPASDFLGWVNLWSYLRAQQASMGSSAFRRMCRAEHLHHLRVREWQDLHGQLRGIVARTARPEPGVRTGGRGRGGRRDHAHEARGPQGGDGLAAEPTTAGVGPVREGEELDALRDTIHQAVLAGLLSQVGYQDVRAEGAGTSPQGRRGGREGQGGREHGGRRRGPAEFLGARGTRFAIVSGSALSRKPPAWVVAGELVETSRLWARTCARIDPAWVERAGAHLLVRTWSEPRWEARRAAAVATERATLFGLPVITARTVDYARIDPEVSRELFVRHALVDGQWSSRHPVIEANRERLAELAEIEDRTRRRGLVVDEERLAALYEARIPAHIVDARTFERWWRTERRERPEALTITAAELLADDGGLGDVDEQYPTTWTTQSATFEVSYRFTPGAADDGVTVHVPLEVLADVSAAAFQAQVPGLRADLVTALLRSLPKALRVRLVPVPDTAAKVLARLDGVAEGGAGGGGRRPGSFVEAVGAAVRAATGVDVPPGAWDWERVPAHLRTTFAIQGSGGEVIARGTDLDALRESLRPQLREAVAAAVSGSGGSASPAAGAGGADGADGARGRGGVARADLRRTGLTAWPPDLDALPGELAVTTTDGRRVVGHPALVDEGTTVGVTVLESAGAAARSHRAGVLRLVRLAVPTPVRAVVEAAGDDPAARLALARAPHGSVAELVDDVTVAVVADLAGADASGVRDAVALAALVDRVRADLVGAVVAAARTATRVVGAGAELGRRVEGPADLRVLAALSDVRAQLSALVGPGFVTAAGSARLPDLLRYLAAIRVRLDALPADATRDRDRTGVVQRLAADRDAALAALPPERRGDGDVVATRWMLEELRVSLFAQTLGTPAPVSEKRIRRALAAL